MAEKVIFKILNGSDPQAQYDNIAEKDPLTVYLLSTGVGYFGSVKLFDMADKGYNLVTDMLSNGFSPDNTSVASTKAIIDFINNLDINNNVVNSVEEINNGLISLIDLDSKIYNCYPKILGEDGSDIPSDKISLHVSDDISFETFHGAIINNAYTIGDNASAIKFCQGLIMGYTNVETSAEDVWSVMYYQIGRDTSGALIVINFTDLCNDFVKKDDFKNKIKSEISPESTNEDIPTAKAIYDFINKNQEIKSISEPKIWELEPGLYRVNGGFYYTNELEIEKITTGFSNPNFWTSGQGFEYATNEMLFYVTQDKTVLSDYVCEFIAIGAYKFYWGIITKDEYTINNYLGELVDVVEYKCTLRSNERVSQITESSTHEEYPSSKAVYDFVQSSIQEALYIDDTATI